MQNNLVKFVTRKKVVERMGDLLGERWYLSIERVVYTPQNTNQGDQSELESPVHPWIPKEGRGEKCIYRRGKRTKK